VASDHLRDALSVIFGLSVTQGKDNKDKRKQKRAKTDKKWKRRFKAMFFRRSIHSIAFKEVARLLGCLFGFPKSKLSIPSSYFVSKVRIHQKSQENSQKQASTDTRIRRVQKSDQKPEAKPEKSSPQSNPVNNGQRAVNH
ncbi:hypothetical protein Tco_0261146, partial [Tanacetum coccineum]